MANLAQDLDLRYIAASLVEKLKCSPEDAADTVRRYKNFLSLCQKYPQEKIVPTADIDEAWHTHILFTREYIRDCQAIFNHYLHHAPSLHSETSLEKEKMEEAYQRTAALYIQEFQEPYSKALDISTFW